MGECQLMLENGEKNKRLKHKLLAEPWIRKEAFNFPVSEKRNLKFQGWLKKYPWFTYTQCNGGGALCKLCVLFRAEYEEKDRIKNSPVSSPFKKMSF
jgi:hypothetical protein